MREIYDVIDNDKTPRPGHINAWALKSRKHAIGTHLQIIFNDFIQEKNFPTLLKVAHITFKKKDSSILPNYRPISVTPNFAKVLKRLLLNQIVEYQKRKQFGFQS